MYTVRRLKISDLDLLLRLQEVIYRAQPDKSTFKRSTPEFIEYCLEDGGACYSVEKDNCPVAYRIVYYPRDREFNLAKFTDLPVSEFSRIAHWDTVGVLPKFRGNALSGMLNARALQDLEGSKVRHLFATSSPLNPHGVSALMKIGFRAFKILEMFGGSARFLFYRSASYRITSETQPSPSKYIKISDFENLKLAFSKGWTAHSVTLPNQSLCLSNLPKKFPFTLEHLNENSG